MSAPLDFAQVPFQGCLDRYGSIIPHRAKRLTGSKDQGLRPAWGDFADRGTGRLYSGGHHRSHLAAISDPLTPGHAGIRQAGGGAGTGFRSLETALFQVFVSVAAPLNPD
jgi:hypothetical protein